MNYDPDGRLKIAPPEVAKALLELIAACGKHKWPMAAVLKAPEVDMVARLDAQVKSLTTSLAKATLIILKERAKLARRDALIADYEARLGIDNEL